MVFSVRHIPALFVVLSLCGCGNTASHQFTKLDADRTGIDFRNQLFEDESFNVLNYIFSIMAAASPSGISITTVFPISFLQETWSKTACS
jgi:hypothetical protein